MLTYVICLQEDLTNYIHFVTAHYHGSTVVIIMSVIIPQSNRGFSFEQYCLEGLDCYAFSMIILMLSNINHPKLICATNEPDMTIYV